MKYIYMYIYKNLERTLNALDCFRSSHIASHTPTLSTLPSAPTLSTLQRSRTGLRGGGPGRRHLLMFTARSDCVWAGHTPGLLLLPPLTYCTPRQVKERREGGERAGGHRSF